jgi:hypothetical protein
VQVGSCAETIFSAGDDERSLLGDRHRESRSDSSNHLESQGIGLAVVKARHQEAFAPFKRDGHSLRPSFWGWPSTVAVSHWIFMKIPIGALRATLPDQSNIRVTGPDSAGVSIHFRNVAIT